MLSEGHCVEQGSHSELMARQGQYYAMASIQPFDLGKSGGQFRPVKIGKRDMNCWDSLKFQVNQVRSLIH